MIPPVDSHFRGARSFGEDADWVRFVERECRPEWPRQEAGCELSEALEIFCKLADFPTGDENLDGFAGKLRAAMRGYLSSAEVSDEKNLFFVSCISLLEPCIKRVLMLADPECYKQLHRPPPDWRGPNYNPTLSRFYEALDLKRAPKRICAAADIASDVVEKIPEVARRAKNLRDLTSHEVPKFSMLQTAQGFVAVWLTMLWVVANYKEELESSLFVLTRKEYLEALKRRWRDHLRKWVLLEADELPMDDEPFLTDLTAGELALDSPEDSEDSYDKEFEELEEQKEFDDSTNEGLHGEHDPSAREQSIRSGRVHDLFDQVGRLILTADAGAGKTTSLQHYAHVQADSLLKNPQSFRPLPLYVELRYYQHNGLWPLLVNALRIAGCNHGYDESQLQREIADGKWFLLLDGVNEVQSDLFERALRELELLIEQLGNAPVVITGRRDVPVKRLRLPVFKLNLLTDEQIKEFLRCHFGTPERAQQFEQVLRKNPRLWEWGRNPLQLWMLVQVGLKARGTLPENRGQLLRRFVDALLKRENTKGPQTPQDIKLDLLTELGYRTRLEAQVSFPREKGWRIIRDRAQAMGFHKVDSEDFIREVCDNHLLSDQGEQLAFAHEIYQEYFAACGLKREYEQNHVSIEALAHNPHWREPIVLLWGLLGEPRDLFDQIVRTTPSLAAECLYYSVKEHASEFKVLRSRLRAVDYTSAGDKELEDVLLATCLIGEGELLANHLRHLSAGKRLSSLEKKIIRTFADLKRSKPTTVMETILIALEKLETEACKFSQTLLAPKLTKDLDISKKTQERAIQLWYKWRDYQFAPIHNLNLASGFRLGGLLAPEETSPVVHDLINRAHFAYAKQAIDVFGCTQDAFVDAVIAKIAEMLEKKLHSKQLRKLLEGIKEFNLTSHFQLKILVEQVLKKHRYDVALVAIKYFNLTDDFPPEPIIEKLIMSTSDTIPLWYIRAFGLRPEMFVKTAAEKIRHFLKYQNWKEALRWMQAFNVAPQEFSRQINRLLRYLLRCRKFESLLECITGFEVPTEEIVPWMQEALQELIREGKWDLALQYIETCGFRREDFAENVLEKALALVGERQFDLALQGIGAFGLSQEQLITHGFKNDKLTATVQLIDRCGLKRSSFEKEACAQVRLLLSQCRFAEAAGYIKAFGLKDNIQGVSEVILALLEKGKWEKCVNVIKALEVQVDCFLPEVDTRIRSLLTQADWKQALQAIRAFNLDAQQYAKYVIPIVETGLSQGRLEMALPLVAEFKLTALFPPEPIIAQLVRSSKWKAALWYIKVFGLQPEQFASEAAQSVNELLSKRQWKKALFGVNGFKLDRTTFVGLAGAKVRALLSNYEWEAASTGIQVCELDREQFIETVAGHVENLLKEELFEVALRAIKTFDLQKRFSPYKIFRTLCQRGRLKAAKKAMKIFALEKKRCTRHICRGIRKLLNSRQYECALRGIAAFGVGRKIASDIARAIHSDRQARKCILKWFDGLDEKYVRFRNAVASCLLQEYQDVTNAVSVVRPMRLARRYLRHNLSQRDKVEALKKQLLEDSSSLDIEGQSNSEPELFGYVFRDRVLAPGYGEFDIMSGNPHRWHRKVVQFRLNLIVFCEAGDDTGVQSVLWADKLRRPIRNQSEGDPHKLGDGSTTPCNEG